MNIFYYVIKYKNKGGIELTEREHNRLRFIINVAFLAVILGLIYFFFKFVFFWISPFVIAFGICLVTEPVIRFMIRKWRFKRNPACILTLTLLFAILISLFVLLSGSIISEVKSLLSDITKYIEQLTAFVNNIPVKYDHLFSGSAGKYLTNLLTFLKNYNYADLLSGSLGKGAVKYAGNFLSSLPSTIIYMLVTIVSTYFMSATFPTIKAFLLRQFNPKVREVLLDSKRYFFDTVLKYIRSYFMLMMVTFVELSAAFLIFGFKPAITLAFFISIVDILPVLGVGTVLIPWSVIELILGHSTRALTLICIYIFITIVRQILEPKIIGDHVGLLPIVTLFCIYVGLQLFGVIGMFLLPITVIVLKKLQENGKIRIWK